MLLAALVLPLEGGGIPEAPHVQGWFYRLLREVDPELHDREGSKPFTLGVLSGEEVAVRVTFLDGALHARLSPRLWSLVGERVPLGSEAYRVRALLETGHPWAGLTTYPRLFRGPVEHDYPLRFASPTFFRRKGNHYPLPEPRLVFGSLYERFKAFAPVKPPGELTEVFERMTLRKASLRTRAIAHETRGVGIVGTAVYHLPRANEEETRWLTALWRFAFYSGVGAKTSLGFGQVRPLPVRRAGEDGGGRERQD